MEASKSTSVEGCRDGGRYIHKNDVWDIVSRPKVKSIVSFKWLFQTKHTIDRSIENIKLDLLLRGQKEDIKRPLHLEHVTLLSRLL